MPVRQGHSLKALSSSRWGWTPSSGHQGVFVGSPPRSWIQAKQSSKPGLNWNTKKCSYSSKEAFCFKMFFFVWCFLIYLLAWLCGRLMWFLERGEWEEWITIFKPLQMQVFSWWWLGIEQVIKNSPTNALQVSFCLFVCFFERWG